MSKIKNLLARICTSNISFVDGEPMEGDVKLYAEDSTGKRIEITRSNFKIIVMGNAEDVQCVNGDIDVEGNVGGKIQTTNGDISVRGWAKGKVVTTNGNIKVGNAGHVTAWNGDIE